MKFSTDDRDAISELQKLSPEARRILDRMTLRDEDAFLPGAPKGTTEFRSGFQACGRMIRELLERKIDWEKLLSDERKMEKFKEDQNGKV